MRWHPPRGGRFVTELAHGSKKNNYRKLGHTANAVEYMVASRMKKTSSSWGEAMQGVQVPQSVGRDVESQYGQLESANEDPGGKGSFPLSTSRSQELGQVLGCICDSR
jgi:hypothetical protein